jgi:hypothetical protein
MKLLYGHEIDFDTDCMDSEEIVTEIAKKLMRIYSKDYD